MTPYPGLGPLTQHSFLVGLGIGDDHPQYAFLDGRPGGQVLNGGDAANENIEINGTAHATKTTSYVILQSTGGLVGIGNSAPQTTLEISADSDPTLRLSENESTTSYLQFIDSSPTQCLIRKVSASGNALMDWDPMPSDGAGAAQFRFFRSTNTTGTVNIQVFKGDNTATINAQISGTTHCYVNNVAGSFIVGANSPGTGATFNLVLGGGATSPVLGAATQDKVHFAGVDNGSGNREGQMQPEAGGYFAWGNDIVRHQATANRDATVRRKGVTTTNATQATLDTIPIVADSTYFIESTVVWRRTGGTAGTADDGGVYIRRAMVTTKSGTVTVNPSGGTDVYTIEDQAGFDVVFDVSTTNVRVRVTGAADNNVSWFAETRVVRVAS